MFVRGFRTPAVAGLDIAVLPLANYSDIYTLAPIVGRAKRVHATGAWCVPPYPSYVERGCRVLSR